ncbi:aspartate aminotransferase family protein [Blastococcus sp. MG754426]|uniref:pyridoxal phosphate-dependent decarboxylase family protein n=1 Tax=unclassified Blastococcus TaxID=2619396 RepID=UPI001EF0D96F|nr:MULTISPECIES: aminotransferase class V-fold PLP-dependent enzyme [unclassified Blastococcus]MCF6505995.1 aspartate aminotransferase family protein [Blastococcus sp. MG754426]MCF6510619.1 aspartate aminotransferase family protein [Blastococcus sp. MG754427]
MTPQDVLAELTALQRGDVPTHGGATMAYVYDSGLAEVDELAGAAQAAFQWTNALDPTAFPSVARIENDLVGAALELLGGGPDAVGTLTSGGTESCQLAVLAAREQWRARGGTGRPRMLLPVTAHAAFRKAAHLFDVEVADIPVDPVTCRAVPSAVARRLDERAVLVVVSAPSYPHGVLDPVGEVAGLAAGAGVPCHVDACIGGWVLPFLDDVPEPFDLSVPGVTSLSVDLHKYGYAPKGVSLLLTATPELRHAHWFSTAGWPGYPVVNPTLAGTRPAGAMAAAWAVHRWVGTDGYRELAHRARGAAVRLAAGAAAIDGLRVVGRPVATLVALAADGPDGVDVLHLADEMTARGWLLQPQPPFPQDGGDLPATLHLTVTAATAGRVEALLADLRDAARAAAALPRPVPDPGLVAAAATIDPAALTVAEVEALLELAGVSGGSLPERMAPVHALVAALPRPVAERLLAGVLGRVYRPALTA